MPDTPYQLTDEQQQRLRHFTQIKLSDTIDEFISGSFLVTDDLVDSDDWDEINRRKASALTYILSQL